MGILFASRSEAQLCPYGIITANHKSQMYQWFDDFPPAFSFFSKMKKKLIKIVKLRGFTLAAKIEYRVSNPKFAFRIVHNWGRFS